MDARIKFKKLLRLNRLIPLEKLDQVRTEKLRDLGLLEDYRLSVRIFPKDWYIRITSENRPYVTIWLGATLREKRAFNTGASYGMVNGQHYTNQSPPSTGTEISTEDFISEIYSKI